MKERVSVVASDLSLRPSTTQASSPRVIVLGKVYSTIMVDRACKQVVFDCQIVATTIKLGVERK